MLSVDIGEQSTVYDIEQLVDFAREGVSLVLVEDPYGLGDEIDCPLLISAS